MKERDEIIEIFCGLLGGSSSDPRVFYAAQSAYMSGYRPSKSDLENKYQTVANVDNIKEFLMSIEDYASFRDKERRSYSWTFGMD